MKDLVSLKAEREILILAMKELTSASHRLAGINDDNGSLAELHRKLSSMRKCSLVISVVKLGVWSAIPFIPLP